MSLQGGVSCAAIGLRHLAESATGRHCFRPSTARQEPRPPLRWLSALNGCLSSPAVCRSRIEVAVMPSSQVSIVIPGDDPPQLQGSPRLDRLRAHGEVVLYPSRPDTIDEKIRRARGAACLINSRSAVK